MQMLEFIEELAKKICEIELCVSNLRSQVDAGRAQRQAFEPVTPDCARLEDHKLAAQLQRTVV